MSAPSRASRPARVVVAVSSASTAGLLASAAALHAGNGAIVGVTAAWLSQVLLATALAVPGAVLAWLRPGNPVGWALLGTALVLAVSTFGTEYAVHGLVRHPGSLPGAAAALFVAARVGALSDIGIPLVLLVFPDGTLPRGPSRGLARIALGCVALAVAGSVLLPGSVVPRLAVPRHGVPAALLAPRTPLGLGPASWQSPELVALIALTLTSLVVSLAVLVARWRRSRGVERVQLRWFASGAAVLVATFVVGSAVPVTSTWLQPLGAATMATALAVAILRYRLYGIDVILNRAAVYGCVTVVLVAAYVAIALSMEAMAGSVTPIARTLPATAAVAVLFAPVRTRTQRLVDRIFYGHRRDPYTALTAVSARLGQALPAHDLLSDITRQIGETLAFANVALQLPDGHQWETVASSGTSTATAAASVDLVNDGQLVGRLLVTPAPGSRLSARDRTLLHDVGRQISGAVHAHLLLRQLQRSRQRIVNAREEERRRLRRDLHDELGPLLAATTMKVDAAANYLDRDPQTARILLTDLRGQIEGAVADIRRLVHDLRPPALDDLGLAGALRRYAEQLAGSADAPALILDIPVDCALPAAVEVAAYRIVVEAMTNAVRHAHALRCDVRVLISHEELILDISDDGVGVNAERTAGVGVLSMRERVAELGGRLAITDARPGTHVHAVIPITSPVGSTVPTMRAATEDIRVP